MFHFNLQPCIFNKNKINKKGSSSVSRSLYTLAVIIIKFKNSKNDIPNNIR